MSILSSFSHKCVGGVAVALRNNCPQRGLVRDRRIGFVTPMSSLSEVVPRSGPQADRDDSKGDPASE